MTKTKVEKYWKVLYESLDDGEVLSRIEYEVMTELKLWYSSQDSNLDKTKKKSGQFKQGCVRHWIMNRVRDTFRGKYYKSNQIPEHGITLSVSRVGGRGRARRARGVFCFEECVKGWNDDEIESFNSSLGKKGAAKKPPPQHTKKPTSTLNVSINQQTKGSESGMEATTESSTQQQALPKENIQSAKETQPPFQAPAAINQQTKGSESGMEEFTESSTQQQALPKENIPSEIETQPPFQAPAAVPLYSSSPEEKGIETTFSPLPDINLDESPPKDSRTTPTLDWRLKGRIEQLQKQLSAERKTNKYMAKRLSESEATSDNLNASKAKKAAQKLISGNKKGELLHQKVALVRKKQKPLQQQQQQQKRF
jgi:hypothetical protein